MRELSLGSGSRWEVPNGASGGGRDRPPGRMPDRRRVAAREAGGFNEEQKLFTAQGRIVIVSDG